MQLKKDFINFSCHLHIRLVNLTSHLVNNKYVNNSFCTFDTSPNYFFGYILNGSVTYESEGRTFVAHENDGLFIPKGINYIATWEGDSEGKLLFYSISFEMFNSAFASKYCNYKLQPLYDFSEYKNYFEKIYDAYQLGDFEIFKCMQYFCEFYRDISEKLEKNIHTPKVLRVQNAVDYIEKHYTNENISIPFLATLCHLSVSRFFTLFKSETGQTPVKMKNSIAISQAINYLIETDYSINQISSILGFSSPSYFFRTFKSITGKTPSSYRKNIKKHF